MIKSVKVTNHLGESIKMELTRPEKSGFAVLSIDGLGPGKATVNSTEASTMDGSSFNSARISSRNIVIRLRFLSVDSIESIRQKTYKYFPLKKKIKLLVETDNRIAEIEGYVESNEPNIFSNEEGTDISIVCTNPFFYDAGANSINNTTFHGIDPIFEFPFSNESLSEDVMFIGNYVQAKERVVIYNGDADTGIIIKINAVGEASNITIYNTGTRGTMFIDTNKIEALTGSGIVYGDEININTIKGNKSAMLLREGKTYNILNCLSKNSDWFQLTKGDNLFAYTAESGSDNLQFRIENQIIYEGV